VLQFFRDSMQGTAAKVIVGIIVVPFALFGIESLVFSSGADEAAKVNGEGIAVQELARAMSVQRNRMLSQMGENADPTAISDDMIRGPVLESLVQQEIMRQTAKDFGLAVGDDILDRDIVSTEAFQIDGVFSPEMYRSVLTSNGLTPLAYKQLLSGDLVLRQLVDGVSNSSFISPEELALAARFVGETRSISYVTLPLAPVLAATTVGEEQIQAYYQDNASRFMTEESVELEYVMLNRADFNVEVSEEDIAAEYQREIDNMQAMESRGAAHIMLELTDRSEAEAIAQLEKIKAELEAGADFSALAAKYSEDTFSAEQGGDIGDTTGDVFPEAFEQALASLQLNEVSGPVVTDGAVHLIKLIRLAQQEKPTLAERRDDILAQLKAVKAEPLYIQALEQLADMSFNSVGLQDTAKELSLELQTSGVVPRSGGQGLFAEAKVLKAAFSPELIEQGLNSEVLEINADQSVVLRVAKHLPPEQRPLEQVAQDIAQTLRNQLARETLQASANDMLAALGNGANLSELAANAGVEVVSLENINRRDNRAPRVVPAAFGLNVVDTVAYDSVSLGYQGLAVMAVSNVVPGSLEALSDVERQGLQSMLQQAAAGAELNAFQASLRANADVVIQ
jgi:peptidyl-prolyl cis-trans isomerase D